MESAHLSRHIFADMVACPYCLIGAEAIHILRGQLGVRNAHFQYLWKPVMYFKGRTMNDLGGGARAKAGKLTQRLLVREKKPQTHQPVGQEKKSQHISQDNMTI